MFLPDPALKLARFALGESFFVPFTLSSGVDVTMLVPEMSAVPSSPSSTSMSL